MTKAFISYSHLDARVLERLQTHLAMLKREGKIQTWTDREIRAGSHISNEIEQAHNASLVFLPIVSPDFLASGYCYDKEMSAALSKAENGEMLIVPIIAEPCDWLASPLAKFKALPKDGKPISEWANENNAYLDIVNELRRVLINKEPSGGAPRTTSNGSRSKPTLRIRRDFTIIDRDQFRDAAFQELRSYFKASATEIGGIEEIQSRYEDVSPTSFTCSIVNRARSNSESHITVHNKRGSRHSLGDIICSHDAYADDDRANEIISVEADEYSLFLRFSMRGFFGSGDRDEKLSPSQVADLVWKDFVKRAGIEYE